MTYYKSPIVNDWQRQIIYGTILGGSSLVQPKKGRNCYLFMRDSESDWIAYKAHELAVFASQRPFSKEANTTRWHSNCYPIFNEVKELFYVENVKTVKMEALDTLKDTGLAVWWGDCGKVEDGIVSLNTRNFGQVGNEIISKYFNEVGIENEIFEKKKKVKKITIEEAATEPEPEEKKNCKILMSKKGSEVFLKTIAHRLPEFMLKKIKI